MKTLYIMPPRRARWLLGLFLVFVAACSTRQENLAELPPDALFDRGAEAFEARNFDRSIDLLEYFVGRHLGDPRAPEARMMLGRAHMEKREYATAAVHFQRLAADYPSHALAAEARFQTCESYYQLSPRPALDQEYTISAMIHCQSIPEYYPGTEHAEQAQEYVVEMRGRLAQKAYETGMFYFRRRAYDSAVVYFEDVVQQYADTEVAPAALGQLVETYTRIGYVEDAEEARERLLEQYPQSPEAQQVRA